MIAAIIVLFHPDPEAVERQIFEPYRPGKYRICDR